jgi:hypothetical protein
MNFNLPKLLFKWNNQGVSSGQEEIFESSILVEAVVEDETNTALVIAFSG